jgi:hypothetical protein
MAFASAIAFGPGSAIQTSVIHLLTSRLMPLPGTFAGAR